jgi:cysteine desulfurase
MRVIDLDQNATTPLDPLVFEAMRPHWFAGGNAEGRHRAGRAARRAWDQATEVVARVLHAETDEVVFTSGGTEANNLAIFGLTRALAGVGPGHVVSTPLEHPAVAGPVAHLESLGWQVDRPGVSPEGLIDPGAMVEKVRPDTRLVTSILAHNEFGAIEPIGELAKLAAERGVPVHTDAVQAVGRVPVDFQALGTATLAASAHKFHGPAGVGLLLVRRGVQLTPLLHGGGQQRGRRPGTPPVVLVVGMARALGLWHEQAEARTARWRALRDRLEAGLVAVFGPGQVVRVGPSDEARRLPQTLQVGFPGVDGDLLLMHLDLAGVVCSLGPACASGSTKASPSLIALGVPPDRLRSSVRFSLGAMTTEDEVDEVVRRIGELVRRLTA